MVFGRKTGLAVLMVALNAVSAWGLDPTVKIIVSTPDAGSEAGTARNILIAGIDPTATDGFDPLWETPANHSDTLQLVGSVWQSTPPVLAAHFSEPTYAADQQFLWQDIRSADFMAGYEEWTINVSSTKPTNALLTLSWSLNQSNRCQHWTMQLSDGVQNLNSPYTYANTGPKTFTLRLTPGGASLPPSTPAGLWSPREGSSSLFLSWNKVADAGVVGYNLYRRIPGGPFEQVNHDPLTQTAFLDTGLSPGSYTYQVTAAKADGCESSPSAPLTVPLE